MRVLPGRVAFLPNERAVTSDRNLADQVRSLKATVETAEAFRREIEEAGRR
ncbi:MAG TPA: hypothetical protein VKA47_13915 [Solirubrobacterales bacterium]|nr:hypothetical protein [Solirubrobacterales bacterium]